MPVLLAIADLTHFPYRKSSSTGLIGCFLDGVFLPCDHGLELDISICENYINQYRYSIRHRAEVLCVITNNRVTAVKSITCMDNSSFYLSPVLFMTSYCS